MVHTIPNTVNFPANTVANTQRWWRAAWRTLKRKGDLPYDRSGVADAALNHVHHFYESGGHLVKDNTTITRRELEEFHRSMLQLKLFGDDRKAWDWDKLTEEERLYGVLLFLATVIAHNAKYVIVDKEKKEVERSEGFPPKNRIEGETRSAVEWLKRSWRCKFEHDKEQIPGRDLQWFQSVNAISKLLDRILFQPRFVFNLADIDVLEIILQELNIDAINEGLWGADIINFVRNANPQDHIQLRDLPTSRQDLYPPLLFPILAARSEIPLEKPVEIVRDSDVAGSVAVIK